MFLRRLPSDWSERCATALYGRVLYGTMRAVCSYTNRFEGARLVKYFLHIGKEEFCDMEQNLLVKLTDIADW